MASSGVKAWQELGTAIFSNAHGIVWKYCGTENRRGKSTSTQITPSVASNQFRRLLEDTAKIANSLEKSSSEGSVDVEEWLEFFKPK